MVYPELPPESGILPGKVKYSRELITDREIEWAIKIEESIIIKKGCLSCGKNFQPSGKFNRICYSCSMKNQPPGIRCFKINHNKNINFLTEEDL